MFRNVSYQLMLKALHNALTMLYGEVYRKRRRLHRFLQRILAGKAEVKVLMGAWRALSKNLITP
jgi:hypothetical protein